MRRTTSRFAMVASGALLAVATARADTFGAVRYDTATDSLIVTMHYRGTNPHHEFTLQWGRCQPLQGSGPPRQVTAVVLDSQWNDVEQQEFTRTIPFKLRGVTCRPALVTLQTAPHFRYTVQIPAAP